MKNAVASLLLQVVLALSGIIVPRFFTTLYGSAVNGLVSSISQFITYLNLVEAGISTAGTVALFKPLADKDMKNTSGIMSAANRFYRQSGVIFLGLVVLLVILYPFAVQNEIGDASFIRTMIIVLSVSGIVDYFVLGKYRMLLMADQRGYIISLAQIVGTVVMTAVSIVMMELEFSALAVKGVAAAIYILRSIVVVWYARSHYKGLDFKEKPDMKAFEQRWAALVHQISGMIVLNSAVVLLTLMIERDALVVVSIYSAYSLVACSLINVISAIQSGLSSGFGQVISLHEDDVLKKSFSTYEYLFYIIVFVAYSCMGILLYPFITLYSLDFADASLYPNWSLVVLFTLAGFLQSVRGPAQTMINAVGHYKQTQNRALIETAINLTLSLALIKPLGIIGVLAASCTSHLYRSLDMIIYNARHITQKTLKKTFVRLLRNIVTFAGVMFAGISLIGQGDGGWISWFLSAVAVGGGACIAFVAVNLVFEPSEFKAAVDRFKNVLGRS